MDTLKIKNKFTPFLRWTGSKRWFVNKYLFDFLPESFNNYHEPFLGAGSVFFHLIQSNEKKDRIFYISDTNEDLINTYMQLRDNPNEVIKHLKDLKNTSDDYYRIRDENPLIKAQRAARFIYLNKTSFNGIYRVNSKGVYNVPYGKRENIDIVNEKLLFEISAKLENVIITNKSFELSLDNVNKNDLIFIDPPYTVAHENNGFIEYNQKLFSWEDQVKLKNYIEEIIRREAFFILTNASHISILELYKDIGIISKLSRNSQVGGRVKTRGIYSELIICNTRA
ncbi:Dam family site-specific DNA-(adenine-N6)-methyltransferase [Arcicella sp. DC2W]|uniref:Site-specific DNA-methyltransferase (adenine-specific) n=1 Tax=Arcicella gelida TaxID=2984195 RepID=A0ABU5S1P3_9BACT|nr:Dam family site-specific DNA-(adenine-N6)-methyltransferase [Arcicella sp. DC2W]MEA5402403.1 Dam family site-specific DNA-(adenine-N6)-methyltransferase [Arcicella sp. DC2W]